MFRVRVRIRILSGNMHDKATRQGRHEEEMRVNQGRQDPQPNQGHVEIKVPATQAEQVADDVAPVTAEYVPAKARDEEYGYDDLNTSV